MNAPRLTKAQRQAAHRQLKAESLRRKRVRARGRLIDFVEQTSHNYLTGWVHKELCKELDEFSRAVARKESPRLIITMPPRAGKTHITSVRFPVLHLAQHPGHEVVCASYGQELASDNSRKAREVARGEAIEIFPSLRPTIQKKRYYADYRRADVDRVNHWRVGGGGSYKAVGVGGPLTGSGFHVGIVDDPLKDQQEADSPSKKKAVYEWYQSVFYTRLAPGGGIIIMATRWAEDDLTGRLLADAKKGGDQWRVVNFPAIAEVDEAHRKKGEALHPARYPAERLARIRAVIGERKWAALYQQRPTSAEGEKFKRKWMKRYDWDPQIPPGNWTWDRVIISADAAFKGLDTSDFVAVGVWGVKGPDAYLLDQVCQRMEFHESKQVIRDLRAKWQPWATTTLIEDKANGPAIISDLQKEIPGIVAFNQKTHPLAGASKPSRAAVAAGYFESGNVYLPDSMFCPWIGDYIEELCGFGAGAANDDQVDQTSQALIYLFGEPDPLQDLHDQFGWAMAS